MCEFDHVGDVLPSVDQYIDDFCCGSQLKMGVYILHVDPNFRRTDGFSRRCFRVLCQSGFQSKKPGKQVHMWE